MGKYDEHINVLKQIKTILPMTVDDLEKDDERHELGKSKYICDNLSYIRNDFMEGKLVIGNEIKEYIKQRIRGEFCLITFLGYEENDDLCVVGGDRFIGITFQEEQHKRQEFLDELIAHYEQLNGE